MLSDPCHLDSPQEISVHYDLVRIGGDGEAKREFAVLSRARMLSLLQGCSEPKERTPHVSRISNMSTGHASLVPAR